jgi:hypothetical protein
VRHETLSTQSDDATQNQEAETHKCRFYYYWLENNVAKILWNTMAVANRKDKCYPGAVTQNIVQNTTNKC